MSVGSGYSNLVKSLQTLREDALSIFLAGVKAADPVDAVKQHLKLQNGMLKIAGQTYDLSAYEGVYVVGAGKAAAKMAQAIEELLGDRLKAGVINVKYGHGVPLNVVRIIEAGHPLPDEAGVRGTKEIIELLRQSGEKKLVFCLLSGGGSALLPCPAEGLTLQDKQQTTKVLLGSGATIHEMNAVRKHISQVKGGRLARLAYPSTLISLILSDVVGDELDSIASGPTVADGSTFNDCLHILGRYGIEHRVPSSVRTFLEKGARGEIEETPKAHDPIFRRIQSVIVGSNILAVNAARQKAGELGYHSLILSSFVKGETKEVAKAHAATAREILGTGQPVQKPACIVSGGETTVTIRGRGLGGRNQEFALAAAIAIDGLEGVVTLSGGTDGTDGPTDAAGAIADGTTARRAREMGMEPEHYLQENDSYHFFQPLGGLLITGPTLTNVMDLRLVLVG
ncbi:MAG: glycerate kinase [Nitrospiraceae bacterium]